MDVLTTRQAAKEIGVSDSRVRQILYELIKEEKVEANKIGSNNIIRREDLHLIKERTGGKPGRPKKQ